MLPEVDLSGTRIGWLCLGLCFFSDERQAIAASSPLVLAHDGQTEYRIVIRAEATPCERYAAEELQTYLARICNAKLAIVTDSERPAPREILVGDNNHIESESKQHLDDLGKDGFIMRTDGTRLIIAGGQPRGTLNGVYTFLEQQLGVRWFAPDCETVPHHKRLVVGSLDQKCVPAFENRDSDWTELAHDPDFAARLRLNGQHVGLQEKHGGMFAICYPFVHSFDDLVPQSLYNDHPEYFPLIDGSRKNGYVQRCLTNPDVLRISIERVRQWISEHPEADIISVSQNDTEDYCQCDSCRAIDEAEGSHAGSLLKFVNAIAEAIEPEHPNIRIDTLAYQYTRKPPRTVRPRHNVIIRLCSFECCFGHPLGTCDSRENRGFRRDLAGWQRIAPTLYIWDYTSNFTNYQQPFPDFDSLSANARLFAAAGVRGVYGEGNNTPGGHGEMEPLRSYLLAKVLWNPKCNVARHTREFVNAYYGKAAPKISEYLKIIARPAREGDKHVRIFDITIAPYLRRRVMDRAERALDSAAKLAENDTIRFRVDVARLPVWYVKIADNRITGQPRTKLLRRFITIARRAGISDITSIMSLDQWQKFEADLQ